MNTKIKSIAVFCASAEGNNKIYTETAYQLGKYMAELGIRLVYGGASIGCMGAVAKGALDAGGHVIGVLPQFLNKREIAHIELTELIYVDSMHERKLKMNELSDACLTIPGGFGTMEEFFEMITWGQLGLHQKPSAILNVNQFYNPLIEQLKLMNKEGLLKDENLGMLLVSEDIQEVIQLMSDYTPPPLEKWLTEEKS
ncbi:MAG: TIGR00730 family Rossman fold protein [Flavobacteriales bacterium]|nr:TIGR00730 family Rossman fold protein [Flavobacteriales bacterium]